MSLKYLWMNGFALFLKLGYSSFKDSITDHNVSLATAFFVNHLATAHHSN